MAVSEAAQQTRGRRRCRVWFSAPASHSHSEHRVCTVLSRQQIRSHHTPHHSLTRTLICLPFLYHSSSHSLLFLSLLTSVSSPLFYFSAFVPASFFTTKRPRFFFASTLFASHPPFLCLLLNSVLSTSISNIHGYFPDKMN